MFEVQVLHPRDCYLLLRHTDIPDWQFDNLFIVTFTGGIARVKKMKYGVMSVQPAMH